MAAQTGRTNKKYMEFWLDNSSGTLTNLSAYCKSVGVYGLKFPTQNVTAFSDLIENVTNGRPSAPLTITFVKDTTVFAHLVALNRNTPLSLDIREGIRQSPQITGEPCFGISSSATSGYVLGSMTADDESYICEFDVYGPTAPDFATTNHA
jgi:hypothetical protein